MAQDNGGWSSIGHILKPNIRCKKCGNDDARLLEFVTKVYGRVTHTAYVFCSVCGLESEEMDDARAEQ